MFAKIISLPPRLFQQFASFGDPRCPNKTGIGLGLKICQTLIGLLGPEAKLNIESDIDQGSKFSFMVYQEITPLEGLKKQLALDPNSADASSQIQKEGDERIQTLKLFNIGKQTMMPSHKSFPSTENVILNIHDEETANDTQTHIK